jgi:hypothetical protein
MVVCGIGNCDNESFQVIIVYATWIRVDMEGTINTYHS